MKCVRKLMVLLAGCLLAFSPLLLPGAREVYAQSSDATPLYQRGGFAADSGERLYQSICQGCHMSGGVGALGAGEYPALAANPKLAAGPYVAMMVVAGRGGMPGFGELLDDRQVIEVVAYVRSNFGNEYADALTVEDVRSLRP
jgi:mono/diheme cytochrome c family protein